MRKLVLAAAFSVFGVAAAEAASVKFYGNVGPRAGSCQQLAAATQQRFQAYRQTRAGFAGHQGGRTATTYLRVGIRITGGPTTQRQLSPAAEFRRDQMRLRRAMIRQGCLARPVLRQARVQPAQAQPWIVSQR